MRINEIVLKALFSNTTPLAYITCDCEDEEIAIYKDMKVMITQNRDKENGVVNGQEAFIHSLQNNTVFLRLPNNKIVNMYPVTCINEHKHQRVVYSFMPSYSLTICKAQGQTLENMNKKIEPTATPSANANMTF